MPIWTSLTCAWALLYTGAASKAMLGARRWSHAASLVPAVRIDLHDVTVVRACAGAEPDLARRLASSGGAGRVIFVVPSSTDPALADIAWAADEMRAAGVEVQIVRIAARGPNRKAEQMAAGVAALAELPTNADAPIVFADSDLDLGSIDLTILVQCLVKNGAAWAPPIEAGHMRTAGDALSHATLNTTLHALPLLAAIDPRGMVGKLFATTRAALDRAGGLDDLHLYIGEDMELARRFSRAGLSIAVAPLAAPSRASGRTEAEIAARYLRWLHVVRAQRPSLLLSYPLLIAAGPLLLVVALAAALLQAHLALAAACLGLAVRLAVAFSAHHATRSTAPLRSVPFLALRGDLVLLSAWSYALFVRKVTWRGSVLTFGAGGRLRA